MVHQPKPMKVVCPQCHKSQIFAPRSDVFGFIPQCKKCHQQMQIMGEAELSDWIKAPAQIIEQLLKKKF